MFSKKGCFCSQRRRIKPPYAKLNLSSLYLPSHLCARTTQKIKERRNKPTGELTAMLIAHFTVATWCIGAYNVPYCETDVDLIFRRNLRERAKCTRRAGLGGHETRG